MPKNGWVRAPIWNEWLRLTKFMGSARIAFAQASKLAAASDAEIKMPLGDGEKSVYRTSASDHIAALNDLHSLNALVLVGSFGLAESHCRLVQMIVREKLLGIA